MRQMMKTTLILIAVIALALPAYATSDAVDLGDGACRETATGEEGLWNGTTADADGCVTQSEYAAAYPVIDSESIDDPLDRQVSVNVQLEPDAPTVREIFEDLQTRLAAAGLTVE